MDDEILHIKLEKSNTVSLFYLSVVVSDDCTNDTVAILRKMPVSDPLCFCGLHMSPKLSMH